jgi:hypothetical protein
MLTVYFHNDGSGTSEIGSYDISVKVNYDAIYHGRIENVPRGDFRDLIIAFANQLCLEQHKENECIN